jgi:hypothetical protein
VSAASTPGTRVVAGSLHRVRRGRGKGFAADPPSGPSRRPARVAITLALAHQIQRAIDKGEIRDQADAAQRLGLTRARLTQIMDLTLLAPDLQERLLSAEESSPIVATGARTLRAIAIRLSWIEQRKRLHELQEYNRDDVTPRGRPSSLRRPGG